MFAESLETDWYQVLARFLCDHASQVDNCFQFHGDLLRPAIIQGPENCGRKFWIDYLRPELSGQLIMMLKQMGYKIDTIHVYDTLELDTAAISLCNCLADRWRFRQRFGRVESIEVFKMIGATSGLDRRES